MATVRDADGKMMVSLAEVHLCPDAAVVESAGEVFDGGCCRYSATFKCLLEIRRSTLALIICGPNNSTLGVFANLELLVRNATLLVYSQELVPKMSSSTSCCNHSFRGF